MFSKENKKRYTNQRTFANFSARDAIMSGRMRLDSSEKTATQASRIPYELKEDGTLKMTEKKVMRQKLNIPSPDRWDTYCFAWLVDYTPANEEATAEILALRDKVLADVEMPELDI